MERVEVTERGFSGELVTFVTGRPVTFTYVRNTEPSPYFGPQFQQHIEPAGRYMQLAPPGAIAPPGWELGAVHFRSPLVIPLSTDPGSLYTEASWKAALHRHYGEVGEALSEAITGDGHDAVVTVLLDADGDPLETAEIVDLTMFREDEDADLKRRLTNLPPPGNAPFRGVVYHATTVPIERFDPAFLGSRIDAGLLGRGFYFSTDPAILGRDPVLVTANVSLERPLRLEFPMWTTPKGHLVPDALGVSRASTAAEISRALAFAGYDGVVLDYAPVGYHQKEIMALKPSAIEILAVEARPTG